MHGDGKTCFPVGEQTADKLPKERVLEPRRSSFPVSCLTHTVSRACAWFKIICPPPPAASRSGPTRLFGEESRHLFACVLRSSTPRIPEEVRRLTNSPHTQGSGVRIPIFSSPLHPPTSRSPCESCVSPAQRPPICYFVCHSCLSSPHFNL